MYNIQSTTRKLAKLLRLETSTSVIDAIDCNREEEEEEPERIDNSLMMQHKMKCDGQFLKSKWNGVKLCISEWRCIGEPTALMFISHDYGEHAQRYVV